MLIKTASKKNLSNPTVRSSFEMELASFFKASKRLVNTVTATVCMAYSNHHIVFINTCSVKHLPFTASSVFNRFRFDQAMSTRRI